MNHTQNSDISPSGAPSDFSQQCHFFYYYFLLVIILIFNYKLSKYVYIKFVVERNVIIKIKNSYYA